jgi:hypothetical protein
LVDTSHRRILSRIVDALERRVKNTHDRVTATATLADALNMKRYPLAGVALKTDDLPGFPGTFAGNVWSYFNGFVLRADELSA